MLCLHHVIPVIWWRWWLWWRWQKITFKGNGLTWSGCGKLAKLNKNGRVCVIHSGLGYRGSSKSKLLGITEAELFTARHFSCSLTNSMQALRAFTKKSAYFMQHLATEIKTPSTYRASVRRSWFASESAFIWASSRDLSAAQARCDNSLTSRLSRPLSRIPSW